MAPIREVGRRFCMFGAASFGYPYRSRVGQSLQRDRLFTLAAGWN